ncbi:MAG: LysE family translocator [Pseudomonadota bacterium]
MAIEQIIAFALFAFVASVTPGPSNVMLLATGGAVGVWRGIPCMLGVLIGMGCLMFAAALGLGSLILGFPLLLSVMNVAGALFLLWLAWKIASADPSTATAEDRAVGFFEAATFQWVNPKGWLVTISAVGTYLTDESGSAMVQSTILAVTFMLAATPGAAIWLGFGAAIKQFLNSNRRNRIFNIIMGALLAASVLMIVF